MSGRSFVYGCVLALIAQVNPNTAFAQTPVDAQQLREEVERLRNEFDQVRKQYGDKLADLERRLAALEAGPGTTAPGTTPVPAPEVAQQTPPVPPPGEPSPAPAPPETTPAQAPKTAEVPGGAAGAGGPEGALPVYGATAATSKIFNPDIAVIGNVLGAIGKNDVEPSPTLQLNEAEASFQAVVDPYARADFFLGFSPDGVSIEEGFVTFPTLPGGLLMKVGRMYESFGKANTMHSHVLPWTDRPLVLRNLVGGEDNMGDAGISVSKLILNPLFFLEATGEVFSGKSSVFANPERKDLSYVGRVRGYRDVTESTNLDVGSSIAYGHNDYGLDTTTRLIGVDATFRWRPLRRAIYRRLIARTELVWSRVELPTDVSSAFGFYASGDYQFARRWFAGARYDYSGEATDASVHDKGPSLLLTFWPSEFSQIRGQYRRTAYGEGTTANEFLFQFLFSIGAHGAHTF